MSNTISHDPSITIPPAPAGDTPPAPATDTTTDPAAAELAAMRAAVAEVASATLQGLTDAQRAAVLEVAGDNVALQIKTANAIRKTAAAPVHNTLPTQGAPKEQGNPMSAPDPTATFVELMQKNPYFATRYAERQGLIAPTKYL
jgi:hypothetical protein